MKYITILLFAVLLAAGCKKEEPCETRNTGSLCVTNQTAVIILFQLEGHPDAIILSGQTECFEDVTAGVRTYTAETSDGWIWENRQVDVNRCIESRFNLRK